MNTIDKSFGASVKAFRVASDLSQRELADRLAAQGMPADASSISRIENGSRSVRLTEAHAISVALECPIGDLISAHSPGGPLALTNAVIDTAIAELTRLRAGI
jgi:transcriptional regulator with XRE-family HTH domain